MQPDAFDRLTRRMGAATTRRGLLRVFAGGTAGALAGTFLPRVVLSQTPRPDPNATGSEAAIAASFSLDQCLANPCPGTCQCSCLEDRCFAIQDCYANQSSTEEALRVCVVAAEQAYLNCCSARMGAAMG
jgi:hypothetical protein